MLDFVKRDHRVKDLGHPQVQEKMGNNLILSSDIATYAGKYVWESCIHAKAQDKGLPAMHLATQGFFQEKLAYVIVTAGVGGTTLHTKFCNFCDLCLFQSFYASPSGY